MVLRKKSARRGKWKLIIENGKTCFSILKKTYRNHGCEKQIPKHFQGFKTIYQGMGVWFEGRNQGIRE